MKIRSFVKGSMTQFTMNPVRTGLSLLGIVFGVSSVIAMITIGEGAQNKILDNIKAMGATLVHITSQKVDGAHVSQMINDSRGLSPFDVESIKRIIPMAGRDVGFMTKCSVKTTSLETQVADMNLYAVSPNFSGVAELTIDAGRDFSDFDFRANAPVVMISLENAEKFFGTAQDAVEKQIMLNYKWVRIIGVYERPSLVAGPKKGRDLPFDVTEFTRSFLIPISTYHEKMHPPKIYGEVDRIMIKCRDLLETNEIKAIVERILGVTHNGRADFRVVSPQELLEQKQAAQRIFNIVLLSIASISLVVGGIGIMNIMLSNVLERRSEIGIRRALGAKKKHIVFQFLFESVLVCLIGGIAGVCLGIGISFVILRFTEIPIAFSILPVFLSFAISFIVGIVFGIVPAWEAANLNPVEALHHE